MVYNAWNVILQILVNLNGFSGTFVVMLSLKKTYGLNNLNISEIKSWRIQLGGEKKAEPIEIDEGDWKPLLFLDCAQDVTELRQA